MCLENVKNPIAGAPEVTLRGPWRFRYNAPAQTRPTGHSNPRMGYELPHERHLEKSFETGLT